MYYVVDCIGIPYWIQVVYKYHYGFVILVGGVDNVDNPVQPPYVDEHATTPPILVVDCPP